MSTTARFEEYLEQKKKAHLLFTEISHIKRNSNSILQLVDKVEKNVQKNKEDLDKVMFHQERFLDFKNSKLTDEEYQKLKEEEKLKKQQEEELREQIKSNTVTCENLQNQENISDTQIQNLYLLNKGKAMSSKYLPPLPPGSQQIEANRKNNYFNYKVRRATNLTPSLSQNNDNINTKNQQRQLNITLNTNKPPLQRGNQFQQKQLPQTQKNNQNQHYIQQSNSQQKLQKNNQFLQPLQLHQQNQIVKMSLSENRDPNIGYIFPESNKSAQNLSKNIIQYKGVKKGSVVKIDMDRVKEQQMRFIQSRSQGRRRQNASSNARFRF